LGLRRERLNDVLLLSIDFEQVCRLPTLVIVMIHEHRSVRKILTLWHIQRLERGLDERLLNAHTVTERLLVPAS